MGGLVPLVYRTSPGPHHRHAGEPHDRRSVLASLLVCMSHAPTVLMLWAVVTIMSGCVAM